MICKKSLDNMGDTIVEVLIAIAVVSSVIGGAYAVVNQSYKNIRQAQERTEAVKIAETQLEQLKVVAKTGTSNIFTRNTATDPFCTNISGATVTVVTATPPACQVTNGITYQISITRTDNGAQHTFSVLVNWENINGNGQDVVTLNYNLANL